MPPFDLHVFKLRVEWNAFRLWVFFQRNTLVLSCYLKTKWVINMGNIMESLVVLSFSSIIEIKWNWNFQNWFISWTLYLRKPSCLWPFFRAFPSKCDLNYSNIWEHMHNHDNAACKKQVDQLGCPIRYQRGSWSNIQFNYEINHDTRCIWCCQNQWFLSRNCVILVTKCSPHYHYQNGTIHNHETCQYIFHLNSHLWMSFIKLLS